MGRSPTAAEVLEIEAQAKKTPVERMLEARVAELEAALRPFAEFNDGGKSWKGTAWEHSPWSTAVVFDHKTSRAVTLDDFATAERVLKSV